MATFSNIVKGKRARKTIELPLVGTKLDPKTGEWVGDTIKLDIRILTGTEQIAALERAMATAKSKGVDKPEDGDPIYDLALVSETLALACIDSDSPESAPVPFFSSATEILESPILTKDHLAFLSESLLSWQDDCSPRLFSASKDDSAIAAARLAKANLPEAQRFLLRMQPGMLVSFVHFMAVQLSILQTYKSSST